MLDVPWFTAVTNLLLLAEEVNHWDHNHCHEDLQVNHNPGEGVMPDSFSLLIHSELIVPRKRPFLWVGRLELWQHTVVVHQCQTELLHCLEIQRALHAANTWGTGLITILSDQACNVPIKCYTSALFPKQNNFLLYRFQPFFVDWITIWNKMGIWSKFNNQQIIINTRKPKDDTRF